MLKDYYKILGVLDDAEDIVIRAAFKALAQKYHPDKWIGGKEEANLRMSEINEAYSVLSDITKRNLYDSKRDRSAYREESEEENLSQSLDNEWKLVIEYFPHFQEISKNLRKISKELEYSFKVVIIERRDFNNGKNVAIDLEKNFLQRYFGKNEEVVSFAKKLIYENRKDAAKALNKAITFFGSTVKPEIIVERIIEKFNLDELKNERDAVSPLRQSASIFLKRKSLNNALTLLKNSGREVKSWGFYDGYTVTCQGSKIDLKDGSIIEYATEVARTILIEKLAN